MVNKKSQFSLIEMLVVFTAFLLLITLFQPTFNKVLRHSRLVSCKVNLSDIHLAVHLYTADHNNQLPGPLKPLVPKLMLWIDPSPTQSLSDMLQIYLNSARNQSTVFIPAFICPANKELDVELNNNVYARPSYMEVYNTEYGRIFGSKEHTGRNGQTVALQPSLYLHDLDRLESIVMLKDGSRNVLGMFPNFPVHSRIFENHLYLDGHISLTDSHL